MCCAFLLVVPQTKMVTQNSKPEALKNTDTVRKRVRKER